MSDENSNLTAPPSPEPSIASDSKEEPKKLQGKYQRREVQMLERAGCGGCEYAEDIIMNQVKPNSDVETILKKVAYDSPEGRAMIKENDIKYSPYIKECLIPTNPDEKPECKEYKTVQDYKYKLKVNE